jgi:hypothetical protein
MRLGLASSLFGVLNSSPSMREVFWFSFC